MTDIVERLRREVPHCEDPSDYSESDLLILKAADEIERLREALRDIAEDQEGDYDFIVWQARAALGEKE